MQKMPDTLQSTFWKNFTVRGRAHWLFTKLEGNRQTRTLFLLELLKGIAAADKSIKMTGHVAGSEQLRLEAEKLKGD